MARKRRGILGQFGLQDQLTDGDLHHGALQVGGHGIGTGFKDIGMLR